MGFVYKGGGWGVGCTVLAKYQLSLCEGGEGPRRMLKFTTAFSNIGGGGGEKGPILQSTTVRCQIFEVVGVYDEEPEHVWGVF